MVRKRFQPVTSELGSYVKLYFLIWIVVGVILFIGLGGGRWAFWGAIGLGCLVTIPIFVIALSVTGVKDQN